MLVLILKRHGPTSSYTFERHTISYKKPPPTNLVQEILIELRNEIINSINTPEGQSETPSVLYHLQWYLVHHLSTSVGNLSRKWPITWHNRPHNSNNQGSYNNRIKPIQCTVNRWHLKSFHLKLQPIHHKNMAESTTAEHTAHASISVTDTLIELQATDQTQPSRIE